MKLERQAVLVGVKERTSKNQRNRAENLGSRENQGSPQLNLAIPDCCDFEACNVIFSEKKIFFCNRKVISKILPVLNHFFYQNLPLFLVNKNQ